MYLQFKTWTYNLNDAYVGMAGGKLLQCGCFCHFGLIYDHCSAYEFCSYCCFFFGIHLSFHTLLYTLNTLFYLLLLHLLKYAFTSVSDFFCKSRCLYNLWHCLLVLKMKKKILTASFCEENL